MVDHQRAVISRDLYSANRSIAGRSYVMQVFFNIIDNVEEEPMCFKMKKQLDALNGPH